MAGDVRTPPSRPLPPLILRGERGRHLVNALNTYRTGEGQGEGHFLRNTPPVRHLFLHKPLAERITPSRVGFPR